MWRLPFLDKYLQLQHATSSGPLAVQPRGVDLHQEHALHFARLIYASKAPCLVFVIELKPIGPRGWCRNSQQTEQSKLYAPSRLNCLRAVPIDSADYPIIQ
jgi:hypothetical protein